MCINIYRYPSQCVYIYIYIHAILHPNAPSKIIFQYNTMDHIHANMHMHHYAYMNVYTHPHSSRAPNLA